MRPLGLSLFLSLSVLACTDSASSSGDEDVASDAVPDGENDAVDADAMQPPSVDQRMQLVLPESPVRACAPFEVDVAYRAEFAGQFDEDDRVTFRIEGPMPTLEGPAAMAPATFVAPTVAMPTVVEVVADVQASVVPAGGELRAELTILPPERDGLGFSLDCGPFPWGVTSGDPAADAVLIWTRATPPEDGADVDVRWEVAASPTFASLIASGTVSATADTDHTVLVDVTGLTPRTTYYYRFLDAEGASSVIGRTKTAGAGEGPVRLAAASCSSIFSGYFNAYGRLAEETDLDLVVHLGDYVYDTIDGEERVRVPEPEPPVPSSPAEWRERYQLYLQDPDFRAARAMHPWIAIWDNHEADESPGEEAEESVRVFQEYVPMRLGDPEQPRQAWRHIQYGELVDLFMLDITVPRVDQPEQPGALFGEAQWAWLGDRLEASTARWRVLGQQKLVAELSTGGTSFVGDASPWNAYAATRAAFFERLRPLGDNVVLSGDFHTTVGADLVLDPGDPVYDPETDGARSVGVEVLGASITRGNFDETICGGPCDTPFQGNLVTELGNTLRGVNPHFAELELRSHGYAIVTLDDDVVTTTWRYTPILEVSEEVTDGVTLTAPHGLNRWSRPNEE